MSETDTLVKTATLLQALREPVMRSAIQALQLPSGSRGLDAGCGIGLQALLLAGEVGPAGHITGLDLSPELLEHAEKIVEKAGLSERISLHEGDVNKLPFEDDAFDWAWSVDCVGYAPFDPMPAMKELARVVKPGGIVAILAWSAEELLPGYPLLEARLSATAAGISPFAKGKRPELHFLRAPGWFREAGLEQPTAQTFAGDACSPLNEKLRDALLALFEMRWPGVESELSKQDWAEFQRLCLPQSPDFILDRQDYYAFFTYSMFYGRVAG